MKTKRYICGDFNSDLLKMDRINNYKTFYEQMCSYGLLPLELLKTQLLFVNNIFTNNMNNKILSWNIITEIDYKSINICNRHYSTCSEGSFRDDVSIQNFNNHFEDVNDKFNDFYFKLEGCVERHAPLKKLTP